MPQDDAPRITRHPATITIIDRMFLIYKLNTAAMLFIALCAITYAMGRPTITDHIEAATSRTGIDVAVIIIVGYMIASILRRRRYHITFTDTHIIREFDGTVLPLTADLIMYRPFIWKYDIDRRHTNHSLGSLMLPIAFPLLLIPLACQTFSAALYTLTNGTRPGTHFNVVILDKESNTGIAITMDDINSCPELRQYLETHLKTAPSKIPKTILFPPLGE